LPTSRRSGRAGRPPRLPGLAVPGSPARRPVMLASDRLGTRPPAGVGPRRDRGGRGDPRLAELRERHPDHLGRRSTRIAASAHLEARSAWYSQSHVIGSGRPGWLRASRARSPQASTSHRMTATPFTDLSQFCAI